MEDLYSLERDDSHHLEKFLYSGLNDEAVRAKGTNRVQTFGICIKNKAKNILGGVICEIIYGNLYIDALWLDNQIRHQGWGLKLILEAEQTGKEYGCTFATVDTMDWEALPFYQKFGYSIEFIREGFEKNSKMYMLRKNLVGI